MIISAHRRGFGQSPIVEAQLNAAMQKCAANPQACAIPSTQITITPAELAQLAANAPAPQPVSQISYSLPPGLESASTGPAAASSSASAGASSLTPFLLAGLAVLAALLMGVFK